MRQSQLLYQQEFRPKFWPKFLKNSALIWIFSYFLKNSDEISFSWQFIVGKSKWLRNSGRKTAGVTGSVFSFASTIESSLCLVLCVINQRFFYILVLLIKELNGINILLWIPLNQQRRIPNGLKCKRKLTTSMYLIIKKWD